MNTSPFLVAIAVVAAGTFSVAARPPLRATPEVRRTSKADDTLFRDLLVGDGGVGFFDQILYPDVKEREVARIDVVTPYDSKQTGVERWHVQHDRGETVTYRITMDPDGEGGTYFGVVREDPESDDGGR